MNKNIVFYSNYCNYSKELVNKLSKTKLHDSLIYICVDDKNISLPNFVNVVPTIYLYENKQILTEDDINNWVNQNLQTDDDNEDVIAYHGNSIGLSGFSTNFSFLEGDNDSMIAKYSFLDSSSKIETPKEFNDSKTNSKKNLESFMAQRENDIKLQRN